MYKWRFWMASTQRVTDACLIALVALLGLTPAFAVLPTQFNPTDFVESKYAVLLETMADRDKVRAGDEFTLAVRYLPFDVGDIRFHIYGPEPTPDYSYIPTTIQMNPASDTEWGKVVFPEPRLHDGQPWLTGQPVATISGRLSAEAKPGTRTFSANTNFSACSENFCLVPSEVELTWTIEVVPADYAGEIAIKPETELHRPIEYDYYANFSLPEQGELGGGLDLAGGNDVIVGDISAPLSGGFDPDAVQVTSGKDLPLWQILLLAMLGGMILNVMPCVLPVVSLKAISLVTQVEKGASKVIHHGLIFASGIITTFLFGAVIIGIVQALGTELGWGNQFQSPEFVIVMASVMFILGLSLADIFHIKAPERLTNGSSGMSDEEGYVGSFFKGVLATLLGTPCVGPFLGAALVVAYTLGPIYTILIFLFVGLGMALPYLVLVPLITRSGRRERGQWSRKLLDKKGWMKDFKHGMSFLMFGSVIYLLYVLEGLLGGRAVVWTLAFLLIVGFAAWLFGRMVANRAGFVGALSLAGLLVVFGGWFFMPQIYSHLIKPGDSTAAWFHEDGWETFSLAKLQQYTAEGKTVLLDFTADWCPNCKTNEAVALNIESTKQLREELGIIFMVADWTVRDAEIGSTLRALGFASVPLTAIFPGKNPNSPILLDGIFGPDKLHAAMRQAAEQR